MLQMTQQAEFQAQDEEQRLDPRQYLAILSKRRFYFLIPLIATLAIGVTAAMVWPPTFQSEGKILVESQQIPTELVRPTITATAKERIQVIQQRVTTRENLLALADKYRIYADRSDTLSRTDMLDRMRDNIIVEPIELDKTPSRNQNPTVALKVGFMHRQADIATKVANELLTLFLNEDARNRTNRAMETTRFLAREVQKIEAELKAVDDKLAEVQRQQKGNSALASTPQQASPLALLQLELAQKSAVYGPSHPELRRLKAQIAALEKADLPSPTTTMPNPQNMSVATFSGEILDGLLLQRLTIQKNLELANQKLSAAKLGETLERDQFSERLEVLEQAVTPQKPLKPNRLKIIALAIAASFAAGVAGVFTVEVFDRTIRGSQDLARIADPRMIVVIPYVITKAEATHRRKRVLVIIGVIFVVILVTLGVMHFMVRPLDELWTIFSTRLSASIP